MLPNYATGILAVLAEKIVPRIKPQLRVPVHLSYLHFFIRCGSLLNPTPLVESPKQPIKTILSQREVYQGYDKDQPSSESVPEPAPRRGPEEQPEHHDGAQQKSLAVAGIADLRNGDDVINLFCLFAVLA